MKQVVTAKSLDPGFRLRRPRDDIKKQNVIPDGAPLISDVIPDGPQGRAGIQTGAPQVPHPTSAAPHK